MVRLRRTICRLERSLDCAETASRSLTGSLLRSRQTTSRAPRTSSPSVAHCRRSPPSRVRPRTGPTCRTLQTEQGASESAADSAVRVGFVLHAEELGRSSRGAGCRCGRHFLISLPNGALLFARRRFRLRRASRSRSLRGSPRATNRFAASRARVRAPSRSRSAASEPASPSRDRPRWRSRQGFR